MYTYLKTTVLINPTHKDSWSDLDHTTIAHTLAKYSRVVVTLWDRDDGSIRWIDLTAHQGLILNDNVPIHQQTVHIDHPNVWVDIDPLEDVVPMSWRYITYLDAYSGGYQIKLYGTDWQGGATTLPTIARNPFYQTPTTNDHLFINRPTPKWSRRLNATVEQATTKLVRRTMVSIGGLFHRTDRMHNLFYAAHGQSTLEAMGNPTACASLLCLPARYSLIYDDVGTGSIIEIVSGVVTLNVPVDANGDEQVLILGGHMLLVGSGYTRLSSTQITIDLSTIPYLKWMAEWGEYLSTSFDAADITTALLPIVITEVLSHHLTYLTTWVGVKHTRFSTEQIPPTQQVGLYQSCRRPTAPMIDVNGGWVCYRKRLKRSQGYWSIKVKDRRLVSGQDANINLYVPNNHWRDVVRFLHIGLGSQ